MVEKKREEHMRKKRRESVEQYDFNEKFISTSAIVDGVSSLDSNTKLVATRYFRELLSKERIPPAVKHIPSDLVIKLVEFLDGNDFPLLQIEAARALTDIASGTSEHTNLVIEHGAVEKFVGLLKSAGGKVSDEVMEQAMWALGNVAGDSHKCRDIVLKKGAMKALLPRLRNPAMPSMLRNAAWTLSNLCKGKPPISLRQTRRALSALWKLIHSNDEEVLMYACWALSYISDGTNDHIQAIIDAEVCTKLVHLLDHSSPSVLIPALHTVGKIASGNVKQTQYIVKKQVLPCLLKLLSNNYKSIRKSACWTISNITDGTKDLIEEVIQAKIIKPLVRLLQIPEPDIQKEAAWAISNAIYFGSHTQIKYFVSCGCVKPLCDLLTCPDPQIVTVCLEGLENILKVGEPQKDLARSDVVNPYVQMIEDEGFEQLEQLQIHNDTDIQERATQLLKTYWEEEEYGDNATCDVDQPGFGGALPISSSEVLMDSN